MDYLPVFHHETSSDNVDSDELETTPKTQESEPLYGSDLLKMSLEATRKQVIFAKKGTHGCIYYVGQYKVPYKISVLKSTPANLAGLSSLQSG